MIAGPATASGRVEAALDISNYTSSVARYAAWSAGRLGTPLELLHVFDPRAGQTAPVVGAEVDSGFDPDDPLLASLARQGARPGEPADAPAHRLLDCSRSLLRDEFGVEPTLRVGQGGLAETLTGLENDVRLFVIGKRGEYADRDSSHLGSQLERVVRSVRRPLLVAGRRFRAPSRVMVAFDGSATTRKGIESVASTPLLAGLPVTVLSVGMPTATRDANLAWAVDTLSAHGHAAEGVGREGPVDTTIIREAEQQGSDLLVMGAYGQSRIRHMIIGSTTTKVLRVSRLPVLLLR